MPLARSPNERLHMAVKADNLVEIDAAVHDGADLNYVNNANGVSPLIRAVSHRHGRVVQRLLTLGARPDREDIGPDYDQALHVAARQGWDEVVLALLNAGATVNSRNGLNMTPLHVACENGRTGVAQTLLAHGADVHAVGNLGKQPLHQALAKGAADTVKLLLAHGADPEYPRTTESPMAWARRKGRTSMVTLMEVTVLRQTLDASLEDPELPEPSSRDRARL